MRSFLITALCLSFICASNARVAHPLQEPVEWDVVPESKPARLAAIKDWFGHLIRKAIGPRQDNQTCYEDTYYSFVDSLGPDFCQIFMHYPNITVVEDVTPTSTLTITTTRLGTITDIERVTPTSTFTVTVSPNGQHRRRDVEPSITPRAVSPQERIERAFQRFRRQNPAASTATGTLGSASLASAFSSACSCQDYTGPTVTVSYTNAAEVETLEAFVRQISTVTTTRTAAAILFTTTVTLQSSSSGISTAGGESGSQAAASGSSESSTPTNAGTAPAGSDSGALASTSTSSGPAGPTAPAFVCPDDNDRTVSQMIGSERFDYLVLCDTALGDTDFYIFNYATFGECVAACSLVDSRFDYPVCQGVSFYGTAGSPNGGNCHLKRSGNETSPSAGINTAILRRIALGISSNATDGTTTEVPSLFAGPTPTTDPQGLSSSVSSLMSNVSDVIAITTPVSYDGLPITAFSTYISAGSTYSSGTTYSFATTYANGSWYSVYYYTWTETWASATTVYGASETGYSIQNSTNSQSEENQGENGETIVTTTTNTTTYDQYGYNITEVISFQTYARNGSEIGSSATTTVFSFETAGAGGGSGGAGGGSTGGPASAGAGPITSTSVFSTHDVIINSGATGGGTSFATGSGLPNTTETVVLSTDRTAFSTVVVNSGETGGAASGGGSGGPGETGGGSGVAASGGPTPTEASQVTKSVVTVISGTPYGTGGEGGTAASGGPSSTTPGMFTNSVNSRNGEIPTESSSPSGFVNSATESVVSVISGMPSGTGGESSTAASGGPSPPSLPTGSIPPYGLPSALTPVSSPVSISAVSRTGEYSTESVSSIPLFPTGSIPSYGGLSSASPSTASPVSISPLSRTGEYPIDSSSSIPSLPTGSIPPYGGFPSASPSMSSPVSISGLSRTGEYSTESSSSITSLQTGSIPPYGGHPSGSPSTYPTISFSGLPRSGDYSTGSSPASTPSDIVSPNSNSSSIPTFPSTGGYPGPSSLPVSNTAESRTGEQFTTSNSTVPTSSGGPAGYSSSSPSPVSSRAESRTGEQFTMSDMTTYPSESSSVLSPLNFTTTSSISDSSSTPCETTTSGPMLSSTSSPTSSPTPIGYFTNSRGDRVPYYSTTSSTQAPFPTSCGNTTTFTKTEYSTLTVFGCHSTCMPQWSYGGPLPFGPQTFGPPVSRTESSAVPMETPMETESVTGMP